MLKSISFIFIILTGIPSFAADYLNYLANSGDWKNYKPDNFEYVAKIGDRAFNWSVDASGEKIQDEKLLTRDPYIIFKPETVVSAQRVTRAGLVIYNAQYSFDGKSRRKTLQSINTKNKNLIFLGCSYTLGTGLNDNETFASYISALRKDYNVFNLGIYGAGANDVLDDMVSYKRFEDIPPSGGIVLYTAIYDHIERSLCTLNCYRSTYRDWVLKKSNYEYNKQTDTLTNIGSFADSRPFKGKIFQLMASLSIFDKVNIPPELTEEQIEHFVRFLVEMKKISNEKLKSDFYFTFYPNYYEKWDRIKQALEKFHIKYLDLSKFDFKAATDSRNVIIFDGHPTKLSNYIYANIIHQQLPK